MGAHTSRTLEVLYPYSRKSLLESHFWNLGSSSFEEKKPKSSLTVVDYITFNQKTNYIYCAEYFFNGTNSVVSQKIPHSISQFLFYFRNFVCVTGLCHTLYIQSSGGPKRHKSWKNEKLFFL